MKATNQSQIRSNQPYADPRGLLKCQKDLRVETTRCILHAQSVKPIFYDVDDAAVMGKIMCMMSGMFEGMTEFRQPLQVQSHLEMPRILVQLGHTQRT